jgi:hypothetical protein
MQNYDKAIVASSGRDYHFLVDYLIKQDKLFHLIKEIIMAKAVNFCYKETVPNRISGRIKVRFFPE